MKKKESEYTIPNNFILARDSQGCLYAFGTNETMLSRGDAERFKHCDLSRYPIGKMEGYDNEVSVIETSLPIGVDEAITLFTSGVYISATTKKPVTYKVKREV